MSTFKGFTTVELRKPKRSKFDLSHEKRISSRMGKLTPVFVTETLPNDTFRCNTEMLLRLAPLIAPIMHRVNVFIHYFFVPNRLLWNEWEEFITNGRLGTETAPVPPNAKFTTIAGANGELLSQGMVYDYLGGDPRADANLAGYGNRTLDLMPFAAWYKIWEDYYRDRNYVADTDYLPLPSGEMLDEPTLVALMVARYRDWQKDYFTSALPWTQRGDEVLMPLAGTGIVNYLVPNVVIDDATGLPVNTSAADAALETNSGSFEANTLTGDKLVHLENIDDVELTSSDVSINDLRRAIRLQEWLERNALAGSRYTESIMAHFARRSSDARLQRAEYLGGGKVIVKISEVLTTAYSEDVSAETVPPGNMAGHGFVVDSTPRFQYNCEEHGFILGIMSVMPNSAYMQGVPRMFLGRNTFLDYPWPSFAHLGEQEVYKYEIFSSSTNIPEDRTTQPVFGYQSRYADWKYIPSSSHGDFRNDLDFWHLTRKFTVDPVLGETFVNFEPGLQDRVFAVSGVDTLWVYIYNNCSVIRSLPYYGTPML